jgi:hypothetical protein
MRQYDTTSDKKVKNPYCVSILYLAFENSKENSMVAPGRRKVAQDKVKECSAAWRGESPDQVFSIKTCCAPNSKALNRLR